MDTRFARRGFLPEPDPLARFGDASEFAPLDELGRDLPSLLHEPGFRAFARGLRIPPLPDRDPPAAGAAALLRPARVPGLGLRQPGRPGAGHASCRATSPCRSADACSRLGRPPILSYDGYALYNWKRFDPAGPDRPGQHRHDPELRPPLRRALVHPGPRRDRGARGRHPGGRSTGWRQALARGRPRRRVDGALAEIAGTVWRAGRACCGGSRRRWTRALYYQTFRPYIRFFENVVYEGVDAAPLDFRGETGAQSSMIPTLVAFMKIPHQPTRADRPPGRHAAVHAGRAPGVDRARSRRMPDRSAAWSTGRRTTRCWRRWRRSGRCTSGWRSEYIHRWVGRPAGHGRHAVPGVAGAADRRDAGPPHRLSGPVAPRSSRAASSTAGPTSGAPSSGPWA